MTDHAPLTDEELARKFHEAYERLAPSFGYRTRDDSAVPWDNVPDVNRRLMIAVVGEVVGSDLRACRTEVERLRALLPPQSAPRTGSEPAVT